MKEKEKAEKEKAEDAAVKWDGTWKRNIQNLEGTLVISKVTKEGFHLKADVLNGANTSGVEGDATINGNTATYVENGYTDIGVECTLTLTLNENAIKVTETNGCTQIGGIGNYFEGEYVTGDAATTPAAQGSLVELGYISQEDETNIKMLLGDKYNDLMSNMQLIGTGEEFGAYEMRIYTGMVRGLGTIKEGIVCIDPVGGYYVAYITDDMKVAYYSNVESDEVNGYIDMWREDFSSYPIEQHYKALN